MKDQRQSQDDPRRRHSAPAALPGKSNLIDTPQPAPTVVGKRSRVEMVSPAPSRSPSPIAQGGPQLIADGTQLRSSMATTVAAVAARSSRAGSSAAGGSGTGKAPAEATSSAGDADLEQTLMALQHSLSRMQGHLDEWDARFGTSEAESSSRGKAPEVAPRPPSPRNDPDGTHALENLTASLARMQGLLAELGPPTPPSPRSTAPGSPILAPHGTARSSTERPAPSVHSDPPAISLTQPESVQDSRPGTSSSAHASPVPEITRPPRAHVVDHPLAVEPAPLVPATHDDAAQHEEAAPHGPPEEDAAVTPPSPTAIELPTRPAPVHLRPPTGRTQDANPDPAPHPNQHPDVVRQNASHDLNKRVFKALSYGGAAVGTAGSFAGWVASNWVGTKIQQTSQTAGGLAKNVVGAVGDYHDSQEKATHDPPGNTKGFQQKIAGQLISALGQAISLVGVLAPGADAARPVGAAVNGIGMIFVGFGELDQGNKAKAYANFAGAACNFIGAAGGSIISAKTEHKVAKIVAEALLDVGADSNAWTPLGGAWDDAAKSKAPGDNRWQKMKGDPKPGGQAINGMGAWLNFAANVMNRRADSELAAGDSSSAATLKIIALSLGGFASVVSTYGNAATAHGEAFPVTGPPRDP